MRSRCSFLLLGLAVLCSAQNTVEGVTFAAEGSKLYVPAREAAEALNMRIAFQNDTLFLQDRAVSQTRRLGDGTVVVPVRNLEAFGFTVVWSDSEATATVTAGELQLDVSRPAKRVEINKSQQKLRAFQGQRVLLETRISSGRQGYRTPNGSFKAGPYKARMHKSSLYDDAPMPWSVQVEGDIFVHGYSSVPKVPASHGCIRVSTKGRNPAKWFYDWVNVGTPIEITGSWKR